MTCPMPRKTTQLLVAAIVCTVLLAARVEWAGATYPGVNGQIAFSMFTNRHGPQDSDVFVMNPDGTARVNITSESRANDSSADWAPDGSQIVFVSDRDGNNEIYVMSADGGDVRRLTNHPASDSRPRWSPDGRRILFRSLQPGNSELLEMNADGSDVRRLTDNPATDWFADYSPDGRWIVFGSDRSGAQAVYVMPAAGGTATQITPDEMQASSPDWSPDGSKIIFLNNFCDCPESDIFQYEVATEKIARLTAGIGNNLNPAWSPDGSKIIFMNMKLAHAAHQQADLVVMNADGTSLRNVTSTPGKREVAARWGTHPIEP